MRLLTVLKKALRALKKALRVLKKLRVITIQTPERAFVQNADMMPQEHKYGTPNSSLSGQQRNHYYRPGPTG
tara:strand:+ start:240 stop:455 length:216 start_codon:yes stop_codon:yes gene_type:complete